MARTDKKGKGVLKYIAIFAIIIALLAVAYYQVYLTKPTVEKVISSPHKIAFSKIVDGNEDIYLVDTEGKEQKLTTSNGSEFLPSWSPDRTKIAFVSTQDDPNGEIYVMNADGSSWQRLTNDQAVDTMPVWSKDGKKIAFLSSRWSADATKGLGESLVELYTMSADGSNAEKLTNTDGHVYENLPVQWLSDNKLLFAYKSSDNPFVVATVDLSGRSESVSLPANTGYPVYSPDGSKVAFAFSKRTGNIDIYVANPDDSNEKKLTNDLEIDINPYWAPDGKAIVFVRRNPENVRIYIIGSDGCCEKRLVGGNIPELHFPSW